MVKGMNGAKSVSWPFLRINDLRSIKFGLVLGLNEMLNIPIFASCKTPPVKKSMPACPN